MEFCDGVGARSRGRAAQVFITGTFNNWSCKVPMHRSGNNFEYITSLSKVCRPHPRGRRSGVVTRAATPSPRPAPQRKHAYKFIVDDEWRFSPDQPTLTDAAGNVNNVVDLTYFAEDSEVVRSQNGACPPPDRL